MNLCDLVRGDSPLVIDVPHAGTHLPPAIAARLAPAARARSRHRLARREALCVCARRRRDAGGRDAFALRRRPQSRPVRRGALPGRRQHRAVPDADLRRRGDLCRGRRPGCSARSRRAAPTYFDPYHATLAAEIERVRARHGYAILLDGHSIRSVVPRFFAGRLSDLNLGTADGASCAPAVQASRRRRARRRRGVHERRQRSLQGRLRDAPLRPAGARRPRAAARDRAGLLHGRGAALPMGRGARRAARRRAAAAGRRAARGALRTPDDAADLHRGAPRRGLSAGRSPRARRHQGARLQRARVEHRRRGAARRRPAAGLARRRRRPRARRRGAARLSGGARSAPAASSARSAQRRIPRRSSCAGTAAGRSSERAPAPERRGSDSTG